MTCDPSNDASRSWQARPWISRLIRGVVLGGPIAAATGVALLANRLLPLAEPASLVILRMLAIMALSTGVIWLTDRLARRLLPLAVLMRLSLLFPDQAPSRLKAALKGGSSRRLGQLVDATRANGLDDDPGTAARQVIELIGALGDHDRRTRGHSERVRLYAEMIGEELKLSVEERQKLQWGALLHDLGKLMVPPEILNKPGKPTVAEWAVIEKHPAAGMQLIEPLRPFLGEWVDAIGGHHEKWDGTGYPRKLRGNEIPRAAAIVAVADSYEVMVAVRSYKKGMSPTDARAELTRCAGMHFSPEVVRAFISISIGRLRLIAGPLAALAQVPFIGTVVQLPSALTAVPAAFSSALMPATAAAAALVAGITLSNPLPSSPTRSGSVVLQAASTGEAMPVGEVGSETATPEEDETSRQDGGSTELDPSERLPRTDHGTSPTTTPDGDVPTREPGMTTTTQPLIDPGADPGTDSTPDPAGPDSGTTTTMPVLDSGSVAEAAVVPAERLTVKYSGSSLLLSPRLLDGSSFPAGSKIYVFADSNGWSVDYVFPGGSRTATTSPYHMMGKTLLLVPKTFTVPSTKGTYQITATVNGNGPAATVVATFTVT